MSDPTLAYPRNSALALDYTSPAIWVVAGIDKHKYDAAVVVAVDSSNATNNGYDGQSRELGWKQRLANSHASTNAINDHNDVKYDESVSSIDAVGTSANLTRST